MITSFESIRGIAALVVALYHLNIGSEYLSILRNGYLFVDLFLVLSRFIMGSAYESKLGTG
jgi:peptidoglycan/LPS O-acetylase OafA/YrhL